MPLQHLHEVTQQAQQMQTQVSNNQLNISHLLSALGFSVTIILGLLAVIWRANNKTLEDQSDRLNDGDVAFTATGLELANLKKDVASIRDWLVVAEGKIKVLEKEQAKQHDTLGAVKIYHKEHHQEELP
jgi:hypothetical protein